MIKVLIIEDEIPARKKLRRLLDELDAQIEIIAEIDTVTKSISFLQNNAVDLILSDIELLDGNVFAVFSQVQLTCPIIFTTAYDQFWLDAFDGNGIAYLLKPFSKERFLKAWDKFITLRGTSAATDKAQVLEMLSRLIEQRFVPKSFKKRFAIHHHQGIYFLDVAKISFFEAKEGVVFAHDDTGKKHLLKEPTLKTLEEQLDPAEFFRLNRSELVNKFQIEKIATHTKNTLSVKLKGCQKYLNSSQLNTATFRAWIEV
jgi:DNA-binding LytR/AlgR family response regulator